MAGGMSPADARASVRRLGISTRNGANVDAVLKLNQHLRDHGLTATSESARSVELRALAQRFGITGLRSPSIAAPAPAAPTGAVKSTQIQKTTSPSSVDTGLKGFARSFEASTTNQAEILASLVSMGVAEGNDDSAAAEIALAERVGLKGFEKTDEKAAGQKEILSSLVSMGLAEADPDDAGEEIALAERVGLKGFERAASQEEILDSLSDLGAIRKDENG